MEQSDLIAMAKAAAGHHNLDPSLVCAVCEQESGWNQWAIRYEPGFLSRYVMPLYQRGGMTVTEAYTRAMSWGLMQILGEVAREFEFAGASLAELCDPATGLEYGCRKLADCLTRAKGDEAAALQQYNGGSNVNYASQVLARKVRYL
jgi:soluble lytic murein transglycosylase-like protein